MYFWGMDVLRKLFQGVFGAEAEAVTPLCGSASHRRYFRITGGGHSAIGVEGTDEAENRAFVTIAKHFKAKGIRVPEVYAEEGLCYLQQDLGTTVLYDIAVAGGKYDLPLLKKTISALPKIQVDGAQGLPWDVCYPQEAFDARMVDFDLNYFKYDYLKLTGAEFNEVLLQDDFDRLKADLLEEPADTFLYRDFNARNVMVYDGEPWFIDFQGGRRGPVYYDVASFIWQARAKFPEAVKEELVRTYIQALKQYRPVDDTRLRDRLRLFVLFRQLQTLGCYGFRGLWEGKESFASSIPLAINGVQALLRFPDYPYLSKVLQCLW